MNDTRPREFASVISDKVTLLIREELKLVPAEHRIAVVDMTINSISIEWNLKKAQSKK